MFKSLNAIAFLIASTVFCGNPSLADKAGRALVLVSGSYSEESVARFAARVKAKKSDIIKLAPTIGDAAKQLAGDLDSGLTAEEGENSPPHLIQFSHEITAAVPQIFNYEKIYVIAPVLLPIEMVQKNGRFLGDQISVSHYFDLPGQAHAASATPRVLSSYVVEAVIPMEADERRIDQDIVQVALDQEKHFPVELDFNSGKEGMKRVFERRDVAILHIDTHGAGPAIQASRRGDMMSGADIPQKLNVPLVLLFGCEGVASKEAFGAVMQARGATAVISSFAKFESFGITGDPKQEKLVYETFFNAIRTGQSVGEALVQVRRAARQAAVASGNPKTLTRQFFVLLGDDELRFQPMN